MTTTSASRPDHWRNVMWSPLYSCIVRRSTVYYCSTVSANLYPNQISSAKFPLRSDIVW